MLPYRLFTGIDPNRIIYLIGHEDSQRIFDLLPEPRPMLAAIGCTDWNRQLSPWPAPAAFKNGEAFGGGAPAFLNELLETIPSVESGMTVTHRMLCGYSLAGLFALWAGAQQQQFNFLGSFSGSLWFPNALPWITGMMKQHPPKGVVLSLGDRESHTRNPVLSGVESCSLLLRDTLKAQGIPTGWQMHPGNHFDHPDERIAAGITELLAMSHANDKSLSSSQ